MMQDIAFGSVQRDSDQSARAFLAYSLERTNTCM